MSGGLKVELGASWSANSDMADDDGVLWFVDPTIRGWDAPPAAVLVDPITGHHGGAFVSGQHQARTVVLNGWAECPSEAAFWAAHARLSSLVEFSPVSLKVYESVPKSLSVIRGGAPLVDLLGAPRAFDWSLSLLALSPFKVGATQTVTIAAGASATVTYAGSQPGAPTITTTAPGTVDLANATTGTRIRTTEAVPSGTEIVCAEPGHTVYAGTSNLYGALIQPVSWLRLMKGANVLTNAGSAPVSISIPDLYL